MSALCARVMSLRPFAGAARACFCSSQSIIFLSLLLLLEVVACSVDDSGAAAFNSLVHHTIVMWRQTARAPQRSVTTRGAFSL